MTIHMDDSRLVSIAQVRAFVKVSRDILFRGARRADKYAWVRTVLTRFGYHRLRKKDKATLKAYVRAMTGYSDAQITRLIAKHRRTGFILADTTARHRFPRRYTPEDVALLAMTDTAHRRLSGPATGRICEREHAVFGKVEYRRLAGISVSHLYNLRGTRQYQSKAQTFTRTTASQVPIGQRRKPNPGGRPGFLRVDAVHQGNEAEGAGKGLYHINIVDEVTQWEIVGAVEGISEHFLLPLLAALLTQFPFTILGFHSDNGSEFINKTVAKLLGKLLIDQTKSRARRCNDNALVEGKNGAIVRKHVGYAHLAKRCAPALNGWYAQHLNKYLNYHRPCGFASLVTDGQGRTHKVYRTYQTPYEKLRSLAQAQTYLKPGVTFSQLDRIAGQESDTECAAEVQKARQQLFKTFSSRQLTISGSYVD